MQLQLEAAWILTNVASGTTEQCEFLINKGGVPLLIKLAIENKPGIVDQAVWAIGNIAGDSVEHRDILLKAGAL